MRVRVILQFSAHLYSVSDLTAKCAINKFRMQLITFKHGWLGTRTAPIVGCCWGKIAAKHSQYSPYVFTEVRMKDSLTNPLCIELLATFRGLFYLPIYIAKSIRLPLQRKTSYNFYLIRFIVVIEKRFSTTFSHIFWWRPSQYSLKLRYG